MTRREKEHEFDTEFSAEEVEGPFPGGDLLTIEADYDFQLSELDIDVDSSNTFDVDVRDTNSSDYRRARTKKGQSVNMGNFEDPVVEAGAGETIAVRARNSAASGMSFTTNVRVDRRRG